MKFCIEYNQHNIEVEAESIVQAISKIIDLDYDISNDVEFEIKVKNNN